MSVTTKRLSRQFSRSASEGWRSRNKAGWRCLDANPHRPHVTAVNNNLRELNIYQGCGMLLHPREFLPASNRVAHLSFPVSLSYDPVGSGAGRRRRMHEYFYLHLPTDADAGSFCRQRSAITCKLKPPDHWLVQRSNPDMNESTCTTQNRSTSQGEGEGIVKWSCLAQFLGSAVELENSQREMLIFKWRFSFFSVSLGHLSLISVVQKWMKIQLVPFC